MEFNVNLTWLFAIAAGILAVINLYERIHGYMPSSKLALRLNKVEELLERDNVHLKEHDQEIRIVHEKVDAMDRNFAEQNYIIMKTLSAILDLMINGNDIDKAKAAQDALQEYLIKH